MRWFDEGRNSETIELWRGRELTCREPQASRTRRWNAA